jgi:hypothetical protein
LTISNSLTVGILKPLRYTTQIGQVEVSSPSIFPVQGNDSSKFIVGEQAFDLQVSGLKPGTVHRVFLGELDVTQYCKQIGRTLGSGLISTNHTGLAAPSVIGGEIYFTFYFRSEILSNTLVQQSASEAERLGGQRILTIRSADNSSIATVSFDLPNFAKNEPAIEVKKTPAAEAVKSDLQLIPIAKANITQNYFTPTQYSGVQTFFSDKEIVQNAGEVFLTSVELYFKKKPNLNTSITGNPAPGVSIAICEVENNEPVIAKTIAKSLTRKAYEEIFSYSDASTPVTFGFSEPIRLATDKFYGLVFIFDDPSFELWSNKVGDKLVGTNVASSGINSNKDGKLFLRNNSGINNPLSDTDLKFGIKCAKFVANNEIKVLVTNNYEFLTITGRSGNFIGGESVFKVANSEPGSISVVQGSTIIQGTGTTFTQLNDRELFIVSVGSGSGDNHVAIVENVANNTYMTVTAPLPFTNTSATYVRTVLGKLYNQDPVNSKMVLDFSTASNTVFFSDNDVIKGTLSAANATIQSIDNINVDRLRLQGDISTPSLGDIQFEVFGTNFDGTNYVYSDVNKTLLTNNSLTTRNVTNYNQYILSRSNEVQNASMANDGDINKKSLKLNVLMSSAGNLFSSPSILGTQLNLVVGENLVSNTVDYESGGITFDSEVSNAGSARSKHISKKITFDAGRFAEDLKLFMTAYRPLGTELRIYAKLYNSNDSEAFDDKLWSPLMYVGSNANKYSSSEDESDFIEYELSIPKYPEKTQTSNVTFQSTGTVLTSTDPSRLDPSTFVAPGDVIRVFNPIFSEDTYGLAPVLSANSTAMVLSSTVPTGSVLVDKLKYENVAYLNPLNEGEVKYYNIQGAGFNGFDTMQIKVVFVSSTTFLIPKLDQVQVIGVSV